MGDMEYRAGIQKAEMPEEFIDFDYDNRRVESDRGVLELAARHLRAFARYVTTGDAEADTLVEDTLLLFLAEDQAHETLGTCFAQLLSIFRRVRTRPLTSSPSADVSVDYASLMRLSPAEREVVALVLGAGLMPAQAAALLRIEPSEAERLLDSARAAIGDGSVPVWPLLPGVLAVTLQPEV